jgi:hypothetical protein
VSDVLARFLTNQAEEELFDQAMDLGIWGMCSKRTPSSMFWPRFENVAHEHLFWLRAAPFQLVPEIR